MLHSTLHLERRKRTTSCKMGSISEQASRAVHHSPMHQQIPLQASQRDTAHLERSLPQLIASPATLHQPHPAFTSMDYREFTVQVLQSSYNLGTNKMRKHPSVTGSSSLSLQTHHRPQESPPAGSGHAQTHPRTQEPLTDTAIFPKMSSGMVFFFSSTFL